MSDDLEPDLRDLDDRLRAQRPAPAPWFRGELGRQLLARWIPPSRPAHLWLRVTAFGITGSALLLVGALSSAGVGPLAP